MRIPIREQVALLILLSALLGLCVISVATWITSHKFVLGVRATRLSLTAALKAAQLTSNLNIMQTSANFISTRVLVQSALLRYQQGNNTAANWARAQADMQAAVGGGGSLGQSLLLQTKIYPKDATGQNGPYAVLNTTAGEYNHSLPLPLYNEDGTQVMLGDEGLGYPPALYPNLTFFDAPYNSTYRQAEAGYNGDVLSSSAPDLFLGPYIVNDTFSMVSLTMPIINNTSAADVLGWLTVVMDARLISQVLESTEGLDDTGLTLLVGPVNTTNRFPSETLALSAGDAKASFEVEYVVPLKNHGTNRHPGHYDGQPNAPFNASSYPAIQQAVTRNSSAMDQSGSLISTRNEHGDAVSVGYAVPQIDLVNWIVLVEQKKAEVWQPIDHLRNVLIACVFATFGFLAFLAFPLAHFAVMPIRRLREATRKSIEPPGSHPSRSSFDSFGSFSRHDGNDDPHDEVPVVETAAARKEGWNPVSNWTQTRRQDREARRAERRKRQFRIPAKVKERKHWIKDELSDLTQTFNEMSDELMMQYEKLEERVAQRTAELEMSKKAAEAANESKTLFIANISHELKTPLNGILGMCAVCMQENDPQRLKRSLGIIYKSGDLLLNLLTDLLTFSKNQVGQHISLDEKEFRLRDVSSQVLAIFDKQAKDGQIDLRVEFQGVPDLGSDDGPSNEMTDHGPLGTGRLKDMILWGDIHRILQVVINLVSNSLKFTPPGGSVVLRIRCMPDVPDVHSRSGSFQSRQSRPSKHRSSRHKGSDASVARPDTGSVLKDKPFSYISERAASPPPGRYLSFEFEVQDTGPGIPENLQQRIFEPFVQGDLGLSKKFGGTGLGLSICSQLAGLMRGSVGVRSTVGEGSTFTMQIPLRNLQSRADSTASSSIDLPSNALRASASFEEGDRTPARHSRHLAGDDGHLDAKPRPGQAPDGLGSGTNTPNLTNEAQPRLVGLSQPFFAASQPMESPNSQPAAMEKMTAEATRGGRIRVLVAEDNKTNQEVVLRMLKLEDIYDVTVAKDGQEALDRVKDSMLHENPYNLIFMDVQMPNVDGLQSTRLIREIGYQAPIVALTAFSEESNIKDCLDSGMNYFLSKPIRRPQLKKVLKEYCAPIPEEPEDVTPPDAAVARAALGGNTTIVMVSPPTSPARGAAVAAANNGAPVVTAKHEEVPMTQKVEDVTGNGSAPVSPFSKV